MLNSLMSIRTKGQLVAWYKTKWLHPHCHGKQNEGVGSTGQLIHREDAKCRNETTGHGGAVGGSTETLYGISIIWCDSNKIYWTKSGWIIFPLNISLEDLSRKIPWRGKWQPTPVLLPRKFHGWRSLVGYSPWSHKESDTTEQLHFHFHFQWRRL